MSPFKMSKEALFRNDAKRVARIEKFEVDITLLEADDELGFGIQFSDAVIIKEDILQDLEEIGRRYLADRKSGLKEFRKHATSYMRHQLLFCHAYFDEEIEADLEVGDSEVLTFHDNEVEIHKGGLN